MKSPQEVEQYLENVGRQWPDDSSIVERVMQQIERDGVRPAAPARSRLGSLVALAAAVAIVAALWWLFAPHENTLYAQALAAIEDARTIHMVTKVHRDEHQPPVTAIEAWFERDTGFRVNMPDEVRIGNQKHSWILRKKDQLAIRSDSYDINEAVARELDLQRMLDQLKQFGYQRYPKGDVKEDGKVLRAYLLDNAKLTTSPNLKDATHRSIVFLDGESRIVAASNEVRAGDEVVSRIGIQWHYNVPVDRELFEASFGDDVRVVDAGMAFDELFSLDRALYREDRQGIVFAIHRLQRFADDGVLVVSSVRADPETLAKYPLAQRKLGPGRYFVDGPAKNLDVSPQGGGYFRIELASIGYQGIDVSWWVVVPRGTNAPPYEVETGKVKLPVGFTPVGWTEYGKTFADANGVLQHVTWDAVVELPDVETPPTLDEIADRVYSDMTILAGLPFRQLRLGVRPGTKVSDISSPDKTSAAEYRAGTERNVMQWYERDLDFQLNGQFTEEMQRHAAFAGTPAIGLNYNPLVDDFTLAEVAKRTSIERLYLNGTRITDAGLRELAPMVNLHELSLNNTPITDAGLKNLESLTALEKVYVHGTQATPKGIEQLKQAIPKLEVSQ